MKEKIRRFWEIDSLRGIAILVMIIFHVLYDLNHLDLYKINLYSYPLFLFFLPFAVIFLLLVGVSLSLSYSRATKKLTTKQLTIKYLKRGLMIFSLGLLITVATRIYLTNGFVIFGVLHCIGLSIILAYPFIKFRYQNLIIGTIFIIIGIILQNYRFDFYWLIWLGFRPSIFYTVDYFPLLPWFGVVLIGIFIGNTLYPKYKRRFNIKDLSESLIIRFLCFLGRNSLIIYLLHQPIILGLIYLFIL